MLFRVLGPLQIEESADPGPDSQQRLLAVLLQRANAWVDADSVVRALWPQDPPASAKGNVKAYVHQLRQVLPRALDGSPRINSRPGGYRLNLERAELDSAVFEDLIRQGQAALAAGTSTTAVSRLAQALELWRGEPYGQLGHELVRAEADRLRALRDEALDSYQQAREAQQHRPVAEPGPEPEQTVVLRLGPPPDVQQPVPDKTLEPWSHWRMRSQRKPRWRRRAAVAGAVVVVLAAVGAVAVLDTRNSPLLGAAKPESTGSTAAAPVPTQPTVAPKRAVPRHPAPDPAAPKLLFGLGEPVDNAERHELLASTPTRLLSTWYRGPDDLPRLLAWKGETVKRAYADGFALHLIITVTDPPTAFETKFGEACGRPSPTTDEFFDQMRQLADVFAGLAQSPPLFVTLFDQVHTYACNPAGFKPDAQTIAYYKVIKARYVAIRELFHRTAPNALVSLGFGAGLARSDDPLAGGGRSMIQYFREVLSWSDFSSVTVVEPRGDNAADVAAMVRILGAYGPVMLSWYGPEGSPPRVINADVRKLLDEATLGELVAAGLFAWSFDPDAVEAGPTRFLTAAIRDYGRPAL